MFDSVVNPRRGSAKRWSATALIAVGIHVALIAVVLILTRRAKLEKKAPVEVTFVKAPPAAPPPPPPPPPGGHHASHPHIEHKVVELPKNVIIPPKKLPEKPPEPEPEPEADDKGKDGEEGGVEGGVKGGVKGGVVGGVVGGVLGGTLGGTGSRLEFDGRMTRPKKLSGPDPQYTQKALDNDVQGQIAIKCVITTAGDVRDCKVLKSLPYMDNAVIEALQARKMTPVLLQGQPVEVYYTFLLRFVLPKSGLRQVEGNPPV